METFSEKGSEVWIAWFRLIWGFGQEKVQNCPFFDLGVLLLLSLNIFNHTRNKRGAFTLNEMSLKHSNTIHRCPRDGRFTLSQTVVTSLRGILSEVCITLLHSCHFSHMSDSDFVDYCCNHHNIWPLSLQPWNQTDQQFYSVELIFQQLQIEWTCSWMHVGTQQWSMINWVRPYMIREKQSEYAE